MAIPQPLGTDYLNSPDHALLHRQFAADTGAPAQTLTADSSGRLSGNGIIPAGVICMWSGTIATIPTGWYLCNGSNSTPDLRDRFIAGATSDDSGVAKTNVTGSLTQSGDGSIPAHTHSGVPESGSAYKGWVPENDINRVADTKSTASYGTGTKTIAVYYALAFIMKG